MSPEPQTITKKELIQRLADETGHTKVAVKDILKRFFEEIIAELAEGNRLEFREFGIFEVKERPPRVAQNPRTLERVQVPARRVVKFKVGRAMRERVVEDHAAKQALERVQARAPARTPLATLPPPAPPPPPARPPRPNSPF